MRLKNCLNFDEVSLDVKGTTHRSSDMKNEGGFGVQEGVLEMLTAGWLEKACSG